MDGPFSFTKDEANMFGLTVLTMVVVYFLYAWRSTDLTVASGIVFGITLLAYIGGIHLVARLLQKNRAYRRGYDAVYKNTWPALAITFALSFFSFGALPLLAPGSVELTHDPRRRLGQFRYGLNLKDLAAAAVIPSLIGVLVTFIVRFFYVSPTKTPFVFTLLLFSILYSFFNLLPIPSFDGLHIFFYSRIQYVFLLVFVCMFGILVLFTAYFALIIAFLVAIFAAGYFFIKVDKQQF